MNTSTDFAAICRTPQNLAAPHKSRLRVLATRLALGVLAAAPMIFAAGCASLEPPVLEEAKPIPAKPRGPAFSAEDHITKGVSLPGAYRVHDIISAELLTIEGVTPAADGTFKGSGVLQTIRLAGIVAPAPGQRGWEGSVKAVRNWTQFNPLNPTIELESDPKFPIDLDGRAMMQVYFKGTSERTASTRFNLNRMLVRSGWAVIDLNAATAIDLQLWMNDEEYARTRNLGLRKYGIILGQRLPSPNAKTAGARRMGAGTSINVVPGNATTSAISRTTTSSAVSGAPVSPGMPMAPNGASMPPGAAMSSPMGNNAASTMGGNAMRP